jgi:hypothetical protein
MYVNNTEAHCHIEFCVFRFDQIGNPFSARGSVRGRLYLFAPRPFSPPLPTRLGTPGPRFSKLVKPFYSYTLNLA